MKKKKNKQERNQIRQKKTKRSFLLDIERKSISLSRILFSIFLQLFIS